MTQAICSDCGIVHDIVNFHDDNFAICPSCCDDILNPDWVESQGDVPQGWDEIEGDDDDLGVDDDWYDDDDDDDFGIDDSDLFDEFDETWAEYLDELDARYDSDGVGVYAEDHQYE